MNVDELTGLEVQPVAPAPAPALATEGTEGSGFTPRFSSEDRDLLMKGGAEAQRMFADQLTQDEIEKIRKDGFESIFSSVAAVDPPLAAAAPVAGEATKPLAPAAGDPSLPEWMLSPEEYAAADAKTKALFDTLLETQQVLEGVTPATDPYSNDPVISWRRQALASGNLQIPPSPTLAELGGDELLRAVDEAYQEADPEVWLRAMEALVNTVSTEVVTRASLQNQMAVQEAYQNGARSAELRSDLINFVRSIPDFKDSQESVIIKGPEGNPILNDAHPAKEFAVWIKAQTQAGALTDAFVQKHGFGPVWQTFQADKAGGFNKMQAQQRQRIAQSLTQKMRSVREMALSAQRAPSVGSMATGGSGAPMAAYHGFTADQLKTPAGIDAAMTAWDRAGNKVAIAGVIPFLSSQSR